LHVVCKHVCNHAVACWWWWAQRVH